MGASVGTLVGFSELTGRKTLDAVDFSNESIQRWNDSFDNCQVMRFRLDGVVYMAVEDPSDGYRSSLGTFSVTDAKIKNKFPPVSVICVEKNKSSGSSDGTCDILQLQDATTGAVILEVGTDRSDDYYPTFVAYFDPTAISTRARARSTKTTKSAVVASPYAEWGSY